jgi:hypothetical protein
MSTTIIILIGIYLCIGSFIAGYVFAEMRTQVWWRQTLSIIISILIGPLYVGLTVPFFFLANLWRERVWVEVKFYWRIKFTDFYEKLRDKMNADYKDVPDYAYKFWNKIARQHSEDKFIGRRFKRHVRALNKKFHWEDKPEENESTES